MTDEQRQVMERAVAVVRAAQLGLLTAGPQKVDCIEMRCHPDDEVGVRALFDAPIVVDSAVPPGTIQVIPLGYAKNITIGFTNDDAEAPR